VGGGQVVLGMRKLVPRGMLGGILGAIVRPLPLPRMSKTHGKIRHQGYNVA
jgi:hypothetical protein